MIVSRFPRLSETFIVTKFIGLLDAGWDVHIVCRQAAWKDWENFTGLKERPELRKRVHSQWPHQPRWVVPIFWLPAFLLTIIRAPRTTWRYWRYTWPQFGIKTLKLFYLDAAVISLAPDILHFEFGALAIGQTYLKKSLGCYLSASFRGYDLNFVGLDKPDYYQPLWSTADGLHFLGQDLWQRALQCGCPPDMYHALIPPAIDMEYFERPQTMEDVTANGSGRSLRLLSVGRLEWVRGYEYAFDAIRLLKEWGLSFEYRIIGEGAYLESLAFARHEMNLENCVQFLGGQPHHVVNEAMQWADVFLHPAVSEGFGNAVLEAQAMQLPVVCSDAGGLPANVVDGQTGFVVPRRNALALAQKLFLLANDPELRRKMGKAGRERVKNYFALPGQAAAFDRFYRDLVTRHAH